MVNHLLSKSLQFVQFKPYDFVLISPTCGPNTYYQIMFGETLDFHYVSTNNGNIKCSIADIGSLKFYHTFLKKCLYHMLVKFEQNRMAKVDEIESFLTKNGFLKPFLTKR